MNVKRLPDRGRRCWSIACQIVAATLASATTACTPASTIVPGSELVSVDRLALGISTKHMVLIDSTGAERDFGMLTQALARQTFDGKSGVLSVQIFDSPGGATTDSAFFDGTTLTPFWHRSHNSARVLQLDFQGSHVTGRYAPTDSSGTAIDQRFAAAPFDSNVQDLVIAALPLSKSFQKRIPVYVYERGGIVWLEVRVTGRERLPPTLGSGDAWLVEVATADRRTGRYWVAERPRRVVRSVYELPGDRTFRIEWVPGA